MLASAGAMSDWCIKTKKKGRKQGIPHSIRFERPPVLAWCLRKKRLDE